ncbi:MULTISPECIES: hypothetical protein [Streptomyces]|uniref:hypothetical protein n=1 Tax=Streptomyces scabiei TaxID=1930 RepID=UPI000B27C118|nr:MULTISPECIES: hypothetical protein [Streptomyces]MDX2540195.1 hypothetical protein [Streptomyces scabiei]MDX2687472.1 hypothetical protein [Streptomyces scabiei]MDX2753314.1 hypothetical protein [Streptomyces scabiei]MDX2806735.1 hypothetical protein [Streptomyces scabiei]MDX2837367.1 hypothetical protein [Streptomyces scabiei]
MWNQLEAAWRTHVTRQQELQQLSKRIDWLDNFSLTELVKRSILPNKDRSADNLQRLLAFFGVAEPGVAEDLWRS